MKNSPGARNGSISWSDKQGCLWLFGGNNSDGTGQLNDLWRFTPTAGTWIWVSGSSTINSRGIYGNLGQASISNSPGARSGSISWIDNQGRLWMFGGLGYSSVGYGYLNDLWCYDQTEETWTWVSGRNTTDESGVYGTQGQASTNNQPGARQGSISWTDGQGRLWMFGGEGYNGKGTGQLNDLWCFDPFAGTWTWVSGSFAINTPGIYGTKGQGSTGNCPGAREGSISWTDRQDRLWMFGGTGISSAGAGYLNDLWCFDPTTGTWTWVSGSSITREASVYGTQGQASTSNSPGARDESISWMDNQGRLWLFGGIGSLGDSYYAYLNDLWRFDPVAETWTWVSGSSTTNSLGIYGTQGQASTGIRPGARSESISWMDSHGRLWLFGGYGINKNDYSYLDDLWSFNPVEEIWTWVGGNYTRKSVSIYGIKGQGSINNHPGSRSGSIKWMDKLGQLFMFGGFGLGSDDIGHLNDFWRYDYEKGIWTWMGGSKNISVLGTYGVKGQASAKNFPGGREYSNSWTDNLGRFWLFGGVGYNSEGYDYLNDLWRLDPNLGIWTWVKGSSRIGAAASYGTKGKASASNSPGGRTQSVSWTDNQGRLWLFGGVGNGSGSNYLNDLWRFDVDTETWTWVSGSNTSGASGIYGTLGQASTNSHPGARTESINWIDDKGIFWMYGGTGISIDDFGFLSDLWSFDPIKEIWTWVSGSNKAKTLFSPNPATASDNPGFRSGSISWTDSKGCLWLFGGFGSNSQGSGYTSDLWSFVPKSKTWTLVNGNDGINILGNYGIQGIASEGNRPGGRFSSMSWTDHQGRLWLFGGYGFDRDNYNYLNDIWRFDPQLPSTPSITITAPENNSNFIVGSTISTIAWVINPTGRIRYVDFFEMGNKLGTDSLQPYTLTRTNVPAGTYRVSAIAITNLGDTLRSDTITVNVIEACTGDGSIHGEGYTNIAGSAVADLTSHFSYPNSPSITGQLSVFEYKNIGDNYGGRLRGYLCVPQTGFYTFYIATDDQAGLWLSTDENPANKQLIAYTTSYTDFRQWNKFNTQQSQPVYLIAGARYYVETLHKEAVGQDHLSIAWKLPDGKFEGPIPGSRLSPFTESGATNPSRATMNFEDAMRLELNEKLQAKAIPNPSSSHFTINVEGMTGTPVQLTVTDVLGRMVEQRTNLQANTKLQVGQQWKPGIYILQLQQGKDYKTIKLIKE